MTIRGVQLWGRPKGGSGEIRAVEFIPVIDSTTCLELRCDPRRLVPGMAIYDLNKMKTDQGNISPDGAARSHSRGAFLAES